MEKNFRWPLTKANTTTKLKCLKSISSDLVQQASNKSQKYAYRACSINYKKNITNGNKNGIGKSELTFDISNNNNKKNYNNNDQLAASWQTVNMDECVQEPFKKIKNELYTFHTTDNFDESLIIFYMESLYDLCYQLIKQNPERSIHDVSTLLDSLFYVINSQVFETLTFILILNLCLIIDFI